MCARSSLLGPLSVSLLRSRISYSCHLAQCLAHRSLDECLLSWSITVRFSEMTQPAQCFTFYTAFVHITSLALHISSQRFQDRGPCKATQCCNLSPVLWGYICRLCHNASLMTSAVSQSCYLRLSFHSLCVKELSCFMTHDTAGT